MQGGLHGCRWGSRVPHPPEHPQTLTGPPRAPLSCPPCPWSLEGPRSWGALPSSPVSPRPPWPWSRPRSRSLAPPHPLLGFRLDRAVLLWGLALWTGAGGCWEGSHHTLPLSPAGCPVRPHPTKWPAGDVTLQGTRGMHLAAPEALQALGAQACCRWGGKPSRPSGGGQGLCRWCAGGCAVGSGAWPEGGPPVPRPLEMALGLCSWTTYPRPSWTPATEGWTRSSDSPQSPRRPQGHRDSLGEGQ